MKSFALTFFVAFGLNVATSSTQTLQECADFANLYCVRTFSTCFEGREYRQVTVNKSELLADNSIVIAGTVTFFDLLGFPKNNYFEMTVTVTPSNMVEVRFSKLNELLGTQYWEYCNNSFPLPQQQQPTAYQPVQQTTNQSATDKYAQQQRLNTMYNNCLKASGDMSKALTNW